MYILPGLLILLLGSAPCSADPRTAPYWGYWKGVVTVTPANCLWNTRVHITEKQRILTGAFTYSGACAQGLKSGTFTATPAGEGCFDAEAGIPGLPKFSGKACFDSEGNLDFDALLFKGTIKLSDRRRRADLQSSSALGGASGVFKKTTAPKAAKKGKSDEASDKVSTREVFIGRN